MPEFQELRITPPVKLMENALTDEECNSLIEEARANLVPGKIYGDSGDPEVSIKHRNCSASFVDDESLIGIQIRDKISKIIGIDKSRFDKITVIRYLPGEEFKRHTDYITGPNGAKNIEKGGYRIATVLMYLNDDFEGGDTDFPWLRLWVSPKKGSILYFDYSDPDPFVKRASEHCGKLVTKGEKWLATIWIREYSRTTLFLDHSKYVDINPIIYPPLVDTSFELEVGPENDRRIMKVELPVNREPDNTIIVGFTGGMDSSLLLYILGGLNSQQVVPYFIKPIMITSDNGSLNSQAITDDKANAELMIDIIRNKVNGNILKLTTHPGPVDRIPQDQVPPGLHNYFTNIDEKRKYSNNMFLFSGSNEIPGPGSGLDGGPVRPTNFPDYVRLPFLLLKKYHIVDAIIQLGLEDIFEYTAKCGKNHTSLYDPCSNWHCMERRWGFTKINREEIGNKYFINKEV